MQVVLIEMPRKIRQAVGPSSLSGAKGIPNLKTTLHDSLNVVSTNSRLQRTHREVVVQIVHKITDIYIAVVLQYPFKGISEVVEKKR